MNDLKKLILLVLSVGVFSCSDPTPPAKPTIPQTTTTPPSKVTPQPLPVTAPEIGKVTMPDGTVSNPKPTNQPAPTPQPSTQIANATPTKGKINPMTGKIESNPEFDEESANIATQLESMGQVNVGGVKMIKPPSNPNIPKLSDAQKETLYNDKVKQQMAFVLKIVSQQYRSGKLSQRLTKTPSGLEYLTVTEGKGRLAIDNSFVAFKSMGATLDGEVFESNFEKDRAFRVKLGTNNLIPGLEEAVKTMRAGEQAIFFIPPALAFGHRGRIGVPPNAMVVYSLNLESVN